MISACNIFEIIVLYLFSLYYLIVEFFQRHFLSQSTLVGQLLMRCDGRTALITGGTSGIGYETTKKLLSFGMNVIIGSDISSDKSEKCLQVLRSLYPKRKVEIWHVDLSSMESVRCFAEKYLNSGLPLHVLINNAGIMFAPYKITAEGFESHMAINYFSHCLLSKLLLPRLKQSSSPNCKARIVNVASCLHFMGKIDFHDINSLKSYCCHRSYYQSKLCQVMYTQSLNQFLKRSSCPVLVNCIHPGIIYTPNLYKYVWWTKFLGPIFFQKPQKGADEATYAALSPNLENTGGNYVEQFRIIEPSYQSKNPQLQTRLWNETWKMLKPWLDEEDLVSDTF